MSMGDGDRRGTSPWERPAAPRAHLGRRMVILAIVFAMVLLGLSYAYPPDLWHEGQALDLVRYVLIGTVTLVILAGSRRSLASIALHLGIWFLLLLGGVAAYGYRAELSGLADRTLGELLPSRGKVVNAHHVAFRRSADLQFWIDAEVNGQKLHFLVDTGATGIVLTRADAARLGYQVDSLAYTQVFETANGRTRGAPIRLDEIRIGPLVFEGVAASVNQGELGHSLLGMGLLEKLSSIEIRNDTLTITR